MADKTYFQVSVPLNTKAEWYNTLVREFKESGIPVRWQRGFFHLTIAFIDRTLDRMKVQNALEQVVAGAPAMELTFDKVHAFTTGSGGMHILDLTVSQPSQEFLDFVQKARKAVLGTGCRLQSDFLLHLTLGRIDAEDASLDEVQECVEDVEIPAMKLSITEAEYRQFRPIDTICSWKLG